MTVSAHFLVPASQRAGLTPERVAEIVKKVLRSEKKKFKDEINVIFVDKKEIRRLNKRFLNESGVTDVIAFPYDGAGDVYICAAVGLENAKRFKEPVSRELTRLVVHGTLHLLGYADEPRNEKDKMWSKQEPLVEALWKS